MTPRLDLRKWAKLKPHERYGERDRLLAEFVRSDAGAAFLDRRERDLLGVVQELLLETPDPDSRDLLIARGRAILDEIVDLEGLRKAMSVQERQEQLQQLQRQVLGNALSSQRHAATAELDDAMDLQALEQFRQRRALQGADLMGRGSPRSSDLEMRH